MQFATTVAIFTLVVGATEACTKFHCYQCMSVEGCKDTSKLDSERCDENQDVCLKWLNEEEEAKASAVTDCASSMNICRVVAVLRRAFWRLKSSKGT